MTYFTYNLGCKVNAYECSAVSAILMQNGYILDKNNPDIIVINTCSVTHVADSKSRQHIRKYRKAFPNAIIVVMGCFAQGNKDVVISDCEADIVIGTSNRNKVIDFINQYKQEKKKIFAIDENPRKFYSYEEMGVVSCSENIRAYLKIQDGCDNFCSYCIVPYRRGKSRSRQFDNVIEEAKSLISLGYKEIVLTGIHVGGYGKDIGTNFSTLVKALVSLEGDFRIRISSIEESEIDDELIELVKTSDKLAKHLHIPLQSGSGEILVKMARKYTPMQFANKLLKIRKEIPDICLTTDVIVGFPGEMGDHFQETIGLIKYCTFNQLHVFPYSPREGTAAAVMKYQIDPKVKSERVDKLLNLSNQLWELYNNSQDGKEVDVIIEKYDSKTSRYYGHTSNYLEMYLDIEKAEVGDKIHTLFKKSSITSK